MRRAIGFVSVIGLAPLAGCGAAQPAPPRVATPSHDEADVNAGYRAYDDVLAVSGAGA